MIKVSVFYPNTPDGHFDVEYYQRKHVPMVLERCGGAIKRGEIERGIAGGEPGSEPPFRIAGHLFFESLEDMQASFGRHLPEFVADIPQYTIIQPTVQSAKSSPDVTSDPRVAHGVRRYPWNAPFGS